MLYHLVVLLLLQQLYYSYKSQYVGANKLFQFFFFCLFPYIDGVIAHDFIFGHVLQLISSVRLARQSCSNTLWHWMQF